MKVKTDGNNKGALDLALKLKKCHVAASMFYGYQWPTIRDDWQKLIKQAYAET